MQVLQTITRNSTTGQMLYAYTLTRQDGTTVKLTGF